MSGEVFQHGMESTLRSVFEIRTRTAASYELELAGHRDTESRLREILTTSEGLLHQKDAAIEYQVLMRKESDHRLLNDMQMVVSLLSMQSRASHNAETAVQLAVAANRVGMIARIHRRLHGLEGMRTVAFKQYLEDFCREFSTMLSSEEDLGHILVADGIEIELPVGTAIPLAFITSELLTNAAKHGTGQITVRLGAQPAKGYVLTITNEGPVLPEGFNPAVCKGLGMKIVQSFVRSIGGELRYGAGDNNQGSRFAVLFS